MKVRQIAEFIDLLSSRLKSIAVTNLHIMASADCITKNSQCLTVLHRSYSRKITSSNVDFL